MCVVKWFFRRIRLWYPRIEWRLILHVHLPKNWLCITQTCSFPDRLSFYFEKKFISELKSYTQFCMLIRTLSFGCTRCLCSCINLLLSKLEKFKTWGLKSARASGRDDVRRVSGTRAVLRVPVVDNASGAIPGVPIKLVDWNSLVFSLSYRYCKDKRQCKWWGEGLQLIVNN